MAQTDTLASYWAPPAAYTHPESAFTPAHLRQVVLRVQLVPAAARRPPLDTLTFHRASSGYGRGRKSLKWEFNLPPRWLTSPLLGEQGEAVEAFTSCDYPLVITEEAVNQAGYRYSRNRYTTYYPCCPVAVAHLSDSVVYSWLLRLRNAGQSKPVSLG